MTVNGIENGMILECFRGEMVVFSGGWHSLPLRQSQSVSCSDLSRVGVQVAYRKDLLLEDPNDQKDQIESKAVA